MKTPMMKCGHAANAVNSKGDPVCVICIGIAEGADIVDDSPPDLSKRMAKCGYNNEFGRCKSIQPSSTRLAFFEYRPDKEFDLYYCGCRGWD